MLVHTAADAGDAQEKFTPFISLKIRGAIVFVRVRKEISFLVRLAMS